MLQVITSPVSRLKRVTCQKGKMTGWLVGRIKGEINLWLVGSKNYCQDGQTTLQLVSRKNYCQKGQMTRWLVGRIIVKKGR